MNTEKNENGHSPALVALQTKIKQGEPFRHKIGKDLAEEILAKLNIRNRIVKEPVANRYAAEMGLGNWNEAGNEPIRFYDDGMLADGQHRLFAVTRAEKELEFLIAPNTSEEYRYFGDSGAKRTCTDALKMDGYENAALMMRTATFCYKWVLRGDPTLPGIISTKTLVDFCDKHRDELEKAVEFALSVDQGAKLIPPAMIAAHYWRYAGAGRFDMEEIKTYLIEAATGSVSIEEADNSVSKKVNDVFIKANAKKPNLPTKQKLSLISEGLKMTLEGKTSNRFVSVKKVNPGAFKFPGEKKE